MNFEIQYIGKLNSNTGNIDATIILENGKRFSATFFTIENINEIINSYKCTGECLSGKYFWASDLIIVNSLDQETIYRTIRDIIDNNEINFACSEITQ